MSSIAHTSAAPLSSNVATTLYVEPVYEKGV